MLIGWKSQLSTLLTWFMCACLSGRNEYIIDCGDRLLRNYMFWLMQIPCGMTFSIDSLLEKYKQEKEIEQEKKIKNLSNEVIYKKFIIYF